MENKLNDYIQYYIGCRCITPDGIGTIVGLPWRIQQQDRVTVHFGRQMVKTVNSVDGHNKIRNHGDYLLATKRYEPIWSEGITEDGFEMPGGVKLILRRMEDITDDEIKEFIGWDRLNKQYVDVSFDRGNFGIVVNYSIDAGDQGIYKQTHNITFHSFSPKEWVYLLSKRFDLFFLIKNGFAIDASILTK
jgi:hypothetical protein